MSNSGCYFKYNSTYNIILSTNPTHHIDIIQKFIQDSNEGEKCSASIEYVNAETYKINDIIVSVSIYASRRLNKIYDKLQKQNCIKCFPKTDFLDICNNKKLFQTYMEKNFNDLIPQKANINIYPFLCKKAESWGGKDVIAINCKKDYDEFLENNRNDTWIQQEYIWNNVQIAGHYLYLDGVLIYKTHYKINVDINKVSIVGCVGGYKIIDFEQSEYIEKIFEKEKYSGYACVDFTVVNGKIKIFEINPRIGHSFINNYVQFRESLDCLLKYVEFKYKFKFE